jgi:peptide deformylase
MREGCLSVLEILPHVNRPACVTVGADLKPWKSLGCRRALGDCPFNRYRFTGRHLYVDRLSPLKRDLFQRKFKKMLESEEKGAK